MQISRMSAFRRREDDACPGCGSDQIRAAECGRNVCTDCGLFVKGGSNISMAPPCGAPTLTPDIDPIHTSSPIKRLQERHPACARAAESLARTLPADFTKGMSSSDRIRHSQALAYLAYRDDSQASVSPAQLASEIRVPEERLSKDVKAIASKLGIRGWRSEVDDEDEQVFARAMLGILKPGRMVKGRTVRQVNRWCRDLFLRATSAGEVDLANMAPKYQADGALAVYCEVEGSPLNVGSFGPPKRLRCGDVESESRIAVRALTKNATAARAAASMRKYVQSSCA